MKGQPFLSPPWLESLRTAASPMDVTFLNLAVEARALDSAK